MELSKIWRQAQQKTGITQKEIGFQNHFAKSTTSNYLHGTTRVPGDAAIDITNTFEDYDVRSAVAYEMFGILKTFDGDRFGKDALSTDAFAEFESHQVDEVYSNRSIRKLIADNRITLDEQASVDKYIDEELDDVLMRISRLVALCNLRKKTLMTVFRHRMKYYVKQHYMSRENLKKAELIQLDRK